MTMTAYSQKQEQSLQRNATF